MKETIRTLHPEKKQGVNISTEKYEIIRKAILSILCVQNEMTFMKLTRTVEKEVDGKFEGSVTWYVRCVRNHHAIRDLRFLIARVCYLQE